MTRDGAPTVMATVLLGMALLFAFAADNGVPERHPVMAQDVTPTAECQATVDRLETLVWSEYAGRMDAEATVAAQATALAAAPEPTEAYAIRVMYRLCLQREATAVAIETAAPCIRRLGGQAFLPMVAQRW